MEFTPSIIVILAFGSAAIQAECPALDSVPVMYDDDTFLCARGWAGPGDEQPIQGCVDCDRYDEYRDYYDGYEYYSLGWTVGSLIVNPGCIFYGFSESSYEGEVYEYTEGLHSLVEAPEPPSSSSEDCANFFGSVKCCCP